MKTTETLQLVTVLISSPSDKMFTLSKVIILLVLYRFKLSPTLSLLFLLILSFQSCHPCFSPVQWYHLCVMVFIFHVAFLIPVTISPSSPVFYYIHSHDETHHAGRYSHVIHFLNCEPLRGAIVILHLAFYSVSLVVTPSNAWVFPHFLWCFTF